MTRRFVPTDDERSQVAKLSGFGLPHKLICRLIRGGISETTLEARFADDLADGRAKAGAKILATLYSKAIAGDLTAMIFWVKCRLQWREVQRVEMTGADGAPLEHNSGVMLVPAPVTTEQWEKMVAKQQQELGENHGKPPTVQ